MKRLGVFFILLTIFLAPVSGQNSASAIFLLIAPGASAGGTGEAQVAAANDAYASYWNPAALAFLPRREVAYQRAQWLPGLVSDISYNFLGARYNMPGIGTFGGHLIYLDLGEQEGRTPDNESTGTFMSYMAALSLSFGTMMSQTSSLGFNVKLIHQSLSSSGAGGEEGTGISTDFAFDIAYYKRGLLSDRLDYGLMVSNIGPKVAFIDVEQADPMPTNMKMGIKWHLVRSEFNRFALLYDVNKLLVSSYPPIDYDGDNVIGEYDADGYRTPGGEYGSTGKKEVAHSDPWYLGAFTSWFDEWFYGGDRDINNDGLIDEEEEGNQDEGSLGNELATMVHNIGIEYWYSSYFAIRGGYIYDQVGKITMPTFGAGIHYGPYGFDFGYIYGDQGHPLTNTMRFSLNIAF